MTLEPMRPKPPPSTQLRALGLITGQLGLKDQRSREPGGCCIPFMTQPQKSQSHSAIKQSQAYPDSSGRNMGH